MNQIAFVRETAWGVAPDAMPPKRRRKKRKGTKTTYSGMQPYYRRASRLTGNVTIYLRDHLGRKAGRITVAADKAGLFKAGKSYTIEQEWL